jgi:hypothetical protein
LLLTLALLPSVNAAASGVDAPAFYRAVLARMHELKEPEFLTYRTSVSGGDGALVLSRGDDGYAQIALVAGAAQPQSWDVAYRTQDGIASIASANGPRMLSSLAIFDPTWHGAYLWLRRGLNASVVAPTQEPVPSPEPSGSAPPVLAIVTAINETSYTAADGGEATCPGGSSARRLWLHARSDPLAHPLTEAVVDKASLRFCTMRFHEHLASPSVTFDLDVELHFADAGVYYLMQGGTIDGAVRPYRRPGWFRFSTAFTYDQFAFPKSLPERTFTVATPSP